MTESVLKDLMETNESLCKKIIIMNRIITIYKQALLELKDGSRVAQTALEEAKPLTLVNLYKMK